METRPGVDSTRRNPGLSMSETQLPLGVVVPAIVGVVALLLNHFYPVETSPVLNIQRPLQIRPIEAGEIEKSWQSIRLVGRSIDGMQVVDLEGVWQRSDADRDKDNRVPTYAPGDQPQYKAFYAGDEIDEPVDRLVLEEVKRGGEIIRQVLFAQAEKDGKDVYWSMFDSNDMTYSLSGSSYVFVEIDGKLVSAEALFRRLITSRDRLSKTVKDWERGYLTSPLIPNTN